MGGSEHGVVPGLSISDLPQVHERQSTSASAPSRPRSVCCDVGLQAWVAFLLCGASLNHHVIINLGICQLAPCVHVGAYTKAHIYPITAVRREMRTLRLCGKDDEAIHLQLFLFCWYN